MVNSSKIRTGVRAARLRATGVVLVALVIAGSGCDSSDGGNESDTGTPEAVPYCDHPETRARTADTERAGKVSFCSAAWVEATDNTACLSEAECADQGRRCMKEPGYYSYRCFEACGNGLVCPEGQYCLECEDSEPHCAASSSCPRPKVKRYDANGQECAEGEYTVSAPDATRVTALCANFASEDCGVACLDSVECCNSADGTPRACISAEAHYNALGKHTYSQMCRPTCSSASDCSTDSTKWCCLSYDAADDEYTTTRVHGQSDAIRVCWSRGIYDFCPKSSGGGGSGGSGGLSACEQCRRTCSGQGSWCQCDNECS